MNIAPQLLGWLDRKILECHASDACECAVLRSPSLQEILVGDIRPHLKGKVYLTVLALLGAYCPVIMAQTIAISGSVNGQSNATTLRDIISVADWGAKDDGMTDNTAILNQGFASAASNNPGATIWFPCTKNGYYKVTGQLTFQGHLSYAGGTGTGGCIIYSIATGASAFSFINVDGIQMRDLNLYSSNSGNPPEVAVNFGRSASTSPSGHMNFYRIAIGGYASKALVYSVASEEQTWFDPALYLSGGGASYIYYTSDGDDLGICSCPNSSNSDIRFYGIHFVDMSPVTEASSHSIVYIGGEASMDISFTGGYMAMPGNGSAASGTGFTFKPRGGAWLAGGISVQDIRFENGAYFAQFGGVRVNSVRLLNNSLVSTSSTPPLDFAYAPSGTNVNQAVFSGNLIFPSTLSIGDSLASLSNSFVQEYFPVTVTYAQNSQIFSSAQIHNFPFTPSSSQQSCTPGELGDDANYHYVCVAAGSWKRVALSSF